MPLIGTRRELSSCGRVQLAPAFDDETKRTSSEEPRKT
jgi:hypothetical protein